MQRSSLAFAADGPDWMADLARRAGMGDGAKEKHDRDARWVSDFCDDLTVAIALREYDQAVTLVEQGQAKLSVTPLLSTKLPQLTSSLTTATMTDPHPDVITLYDIEAKPGVGPWSLNTWKAR